MPAKKSTAKSSPKKKPAAKKAPAKKSVAKKSAPAAAAYHHRPFMQTKFTEQTIYWLVIGVAVLALAAWVLSLQVQLNEMYDQIELSSGMSYVD